MSSRIDRLLPGYGCGSCGFQDCKQFAKAALEKKVDTSDCPFMQRDMFKEEKEAIEKLINAGTENEKIIKVLQQESRVLSLPSLQK